MKLNKFELALLFLLIIIPFILVIAILQPMTEGLHGTTYASADNIYEFDGEVTGNDPQDSGFSHEGHFRGDIYIQGGTGWILCNGKVRYSGEVHIRNADCDYEVNSEDHDGSFFPVNYQDITLDGTEGEMEGGFPYCYFGFIGSAAGFAFWITYIISKRNLPAEKATYFVSVVLVLAGITGLLFNLCCLPVVLAIPIFVLLYKIYGALYPTLRTSYYPYPRKQLLPLSLSKFKCALLLMFCGLFIFYVSIFFFVFPPFSFDSYYSYTSGMSYFYFGMIGIISSPGLIGFGTGKLTKSRSENV